MAAFSTACSSVPQPEVLSVKHRMPIRDDFETFLIKIDDGNWQDSSDTVRWQLHRGRNQIEMRIRNRAGVLGCKSWLELQY
jgi:hypothetical protein